ncbi:MAG: hypothetical protein NTY51_09175, partial [Deltaproteobacteria bacterium]|nr:hypothetical protein [Deltaproteobacteria bacterium]
DILFLSFTGVSCDKAFFLLKTLYHGPAREAHLLRMLKPSKNTFARGSCTCQQSKRRLPMKLNSDNLYGIGHKRQRFREVTLIYGQGIRTSQ